MERLVDIFQIEAIPSEKKGLIQTVLDMWQFQSAGLVRYIEDADLRQEEQFALRNFENLRNLCRGAKTDCDDIKIFACYDRSRKLQSLAAIQEVPGTRSRYLSWLMTNPDNIPTSSLLGHRPEARTKGAPTALMYHLFLQCIEDDKESMVLNPSDKELISFYSKFGFSEEEDEEGDCFLRITLQGMKASLTGKEGSLPAIQQLWNKIIVDEPIAA